MSLRVKKHLEGQANLKPQLTPNKSQKKHKTNNLDINYLTRSFN